MTSAHKALSFRRCCGNWDIPIIMVTTNADIKDLSAAFHAGAMDYIQKTPIQDELHVRVRSVLLNDIFSLFDAIISASRIVNQYPRDPRE